MAGNDCRILLTSNTAAHAFLRSPDGHFTTYEGPGAGTGFMQGTGTASTIGLSPEGAVTGAIIDSGNTFHGYVRSPDGNITVLHIPGAGTGAFQGSDTDGFNLEGVISGVDIDADNVLHGWVRSPDGHITTFDAPGAGTGPGQGTQPQGLKRRECDRRGSD